MEGTEYFQNKNVNNEVDVMYKICLGRWFLVQTFEEEIDDLEQDIAEIRELLDENDQLGSKN